MMYLCFFLVNPSLSTNASSLENNELEQMSFAKDKPLQMYKKRTPLLASDPRPCRCLLFLFFIHNLVRILLFLLNISFDDDIYSDLDQLIAL